MPFDPSPWRPMQPADMPAVAALADIVHPGLPEDKSVLAAKARLYPAGCWVLEHDRAISGYLLSHPWRRFQPPKLNSLIERLPAEADCLYIHDLAIDPSARGKGYSVAIIDRIKAQARHSGFGVLALISVYGTTGFWKCFGFIGRAGYRGSSILDGYGSDADYMEYAFDFTGTAA